MTETPWPDQVPSKLDIRAVRGPLTRNILLRYGFNCPEVYGDPGLLIPVLYPYARTSQYKIGIVPHYIDQDKVPICLRNNNLVISITDQPEKVVRMILACDLILSSSLHGIITAEAFGIPAAWVEFSRGVAGSGFKFRDYYLGTGREVDGPTSYHNPIPQEAPIFDRKRLILSFPVVAPISTVLL